MTVRMLAVLACTALAACGTPAAEDAPVPVAQVRTALVTQGTGDEGIAIYGVAEPGAGGERTLTAPVEAQLVTILAPEGTAVRAGQAVAILTPGANAKLDLVKAASDAAAAQASLDRAMRLRTDGLMSNADVETARAAAAAAAATRTSLAGRTAALTLRAPVAGTVAAITPVPGDLLAAGALVARITVNGNLRGRFGIKPSLVMRIAIGAPALLRPGGARGAPLGVRVSAIDPVVDPQTRLAALFITLPAAAGVVGGEPLSGELTIHQAAPGLSLPYAALLDEAGQPYVFVIEDGVAHRRDVVTGPVTGDSIQVVKGVKAGDRVAVAGVTGLNDGIKVREAK